ncbi:MAG: hypothetical protein Q8O10_10360 [candidate division Zixibacteria bacterium]|nr:hypothetical protein [candidate division Zixibacteria bacterium]
MRSSELIETLERFFNEIIGTLVPGLLLVLSLSYILGSPVRIGVLSLFPPSSSFEWFLMILLSYISGHFVISFGNVVIINLGNYLINLQKKVRAFKFLIPKSWNLKSDDELLGSIIESDDFRAFRDLMQLDVGNQRSETSNKTVVHSMRSIAMTIASDDIHIVHRFMFISLFNLGISTILIMMVIIQLGIYLLHRFSIISVNFELNILSLLIPAVLSLFFIARRYEFYSRAMRVPFPMALARLRSKAHSSNNVKELSASKNMQHNRVNVIDQKKKLSIYLAGGFYTKWQDAIINRYPNIHFLDPRSHGFQGEKEYTFWDLEAIKNCDCIFAYLEADNPSGFALASELGFAKALGKIIIFVDEKSLTDKEVARYFKMLHEISDADFDNFEEGLDFLDKYIVMKQSSMLPT